MDINLNVICNDAAIHVLMLCAAEIRSCRETNEAMSKNPACCFVARPTFSRLGKFDGLIHRRGVQEYTIIINNDVAYDIWSRSWISKTITFDMFKSGLLIHEAAHIRYSFNHNVDDNWKQNQLYGIINNMLEDAMIEYRLSLEFPEYAKYFTFMLAAIKTAVTSSKRPSSKEIQSVQDKLQQSVEEVYTLARFDQIIGTDDKFTSAILPLIVAARRSDSMGSHMASVAIHNLIVMDVSNQEQQERKKSQSAKEDEFEDANDIADDVADDIKTVIKNMKEQKRSSTNREMNKLKQQLDEDQQEEFEEQLQQIKTTASDTKVEIEHKERTKFFIETAKRFSKQIELIRNIFMKAFTERIMVSAADGDLNVMRQQQAYINSITMETGMDYQYAKTKKVLLDVVVMRDISGSTTGFSKEYAEAVVILLSALENIDGIRTAAIDFGPCNDERKSFDQKIDECKIEPTATGGTSIASALTRASKYSYKGKKNLVFIISDGDIFDWRPAELIENKMKSAGISIIKIAIGGYTNKGYISMKIEDMPKTMAEIILKEVQSQC